MPLVKPPSTYAQGFHTKAFLWRGIYVLGNNEVPDEAVYRAAEIVFNSLAGVDQSIIDQLVKYHARFAVIPYGTEITTLPDYDDLDSTWSHYRGLGGVIGRPTSSSGEENLIPGAPDDPYLHEESIGLHEWMHAVEGIGLAKANPTLHAAFQAAYDHAHANHLWDNTYAGSNFYEYFAETAQAYFNNNPERTEPGDGIHNSINTRAELAAYDPEVFALHQQLFGTSTWEVGDNFGSDAADTLVGTSGNDLILGNGGDDDLSGGTGNDDLLGGTGLDSIQGNAGKDNLDGEKGNDALNGGQGSDTITGGLGADKLTGGAGKDRFVFNTKLGAGNIDTIVDFKHNSDLLQLDDAFFKAIGTKLDAGEFYARGGTVKAHDADDRILYSTSSGKLSYDSDGKGGKAAIHFATLTDGTTTIPYLDAGDFVIV